ncbi:MAG: prenyltransferase/squalene oxidase repeat-containing protein [Planctomycetota bacterium]
MYRATRFIALVLVGVVSHSAVAEQSSEVLSTPVSTGKMVDRAVAFLETSRDDNGAFSPHLGPAITGLVATGLLRHGRSINDPLVGDAVAYVAGFAQPDGGIHAPGSRYRNYETCVAIQCLKEAAQAPGAKTDYAEELAAAEAFIKGLQWDDEEGHQIDSNNYGGAGYGRHGRPDLSNTSFLIDALHSLGRGKDDPAIQRALVFVSRTQNLETEHNTTEFAAKVNDGGFYYTPAAGGSSQAGETAGGGLRSYASMTYAGLKSMIYAGVGPDDPRVKAAYKWVQRHYSLDENPGMGTSGLYYYYHTFAKALDATGEDVLIDAEGVEHDWRAELAAKLAEEQQPTGAWVNENDRWLESDPNLATAYVLLALSY